MYADQVTDAMRRAIDETDRRRAKQTDYNQAHGIEPRSIVKGVHDLTERVKKVAEGQAAYSVQADTLTPKELRHLITELEAEMKKAAAELEFERAAVLRDEVTDLRETLRLLDTRPEWQRLRDLDPFRTADG